jgi:DNA-binding transcriptional LysR family regulator
MAGCSGRPVLAVYLEIPASSFGFSEGSPMPAIRRSSDYRVDPFDLQLFASVVETGTITDAAQAMNLSLAAASARLKSLEARVGVQLLERSKRGCAVTDAGRSLVRHARRVLADLDTLHIEMGAFGQGLRGSVRMLCNTSALAEALPKRIGAFLIEHPDIDLDLREHCSDAVLEGLRRGVADVGIVADHVDTSGLITQPWIHDQLVALLPPQGRRRSPCTLRFVELLDRPFVGLSADSALSRFLLQQAAQSGRVPQYRVRLSGFDAIAQLVEAGVGVAVVPVSTVGRWRDARVEVVGLQDAWANRRLLICSTAQAAGQPAVEALIDALLSG